MYILLTFTLNLNRSMHVIHVCMKGLEQTVNLVTFALCVIDKNEFEVLIVGVRHTAVILQSVVIFLNILIYYM